MIVTNYNIWIYFRILIEIQFTKKKKKNKDYIWQTKMYQTMNKCISICKQKIKIHSEYEKIYVIWK